VLNRNGRAEAALKHVEQLLAKAPRDPGYRNLRAAILANLGDYSAAIGVYERLLEELPAQARMWLSYGHALRTTGRRPRASRPIAARLRSRLRWARPTGAWLISRHFSSAGKMRARCARPSGARISRTRTACISSLRSARCLRTRSPARSRLPT